MLGLKSDSSERWVQQALDNIDVVLIDHAHCEKKVAGYALNLMFAYIEHEDLCRAMTEIVNEELEHFHMVLDLLKKRGVRFRRIKPSGYGKRLNELVRKGEPERAIDRLLVASLIEARSCERFDLLRQRSPDAELRDFYGSLFASEARHHSTFARLARTFAEQPVVDQRLEELATAEAEILAEGEPSPRVHS
jgi:tRNA-(ms[2]io[6]A)-hydroxylase